MAKIKLDKYKIVKLDKLKGVSEGDYDKEGNCVVFCDECHGWQFGQIDIPTKQVCISCHNCDDNFMIGDWIDKFEVIGNIHD